MSTYKTLYDKTVLCIDDDPDILEAVALILKSLVRHVVLAPSGEAGVALAVQRQPDLIFLDVGLPRMDGWKVIQMLKDRGLRTTPVVMLTAHGGVEDIFQGYHEGCIYYITKPFKREHVTNVVEYLLGELTEEERNRIELVL